MRQTATWKYIRYVVTNSSPSTMRHVELNNLQNFGQIYLTYLRSTRQYLKIGNEYKGKGERTVQDTASLVGFKLPESCDTKPEIDYSIKKNKKESS